MQNPFSLKAFTQKYTDVRKGTFTGLKLFSREQRKLSSKFWKVRKMDPFEGVKKISISTIIFGILTLLIGWSVTQVSDYILRLEIGVIALVFLVLFFYSLVMDRISQMEEKMIILSGKRERSEKLVP